MAWLVEHQVKHEYRDILKQPLQQDELMWLAQLGNFSIVGLLNPKSTGLKEMKIDISTVSESEAVELIQKNPKIMYRPLLTDGERIIVGFKPDEYATMTT